MAVVVVGGDLVRGSDRPEATQTVDEDPRGELGGLRTLDKPVEMCSDGSGTEM